MKTLFQRCSVLVALTLGLTSISLSGDVHAAGGPKVLKLATKGDTLNFDKKVLSVKPGEKVKLVFKNGTAPSAGLQHNVVIVNPGKADEIATAGISAGPDKGYTPDSADIIAKTKLIPGGATDTVEFTAPATAGDYPFLCTFPGHGTMMRGVLKVK